MRIWTNGCFDILHVGHYEMLKYAKSLGDQLIVGIDSDSRVKKMKGEDRPFNNEWIRQYQLEQLKAVDRVYIYDSDDELIQLIRNIEPEIMIIGSDWKGKRVIGEEYVPRVEYFDRIEGYSTTKIIEDMRK